MGRLDEALALGEEAAQRFPLLAVVWNDLALVHRIRTEREAEARALVRALELSPAWGDASRALAEVYERMDRVSDARAVLNAAILASPLDYLVQAAMAAFLWRQGERDAALERIELTVTREPAYDWAWDTLQEWAPLLGRPDAAENAARQLTVSRPGEARSWYRLAAVVQDPDRKMAALDQAIRLSPRFIDAHDARAVTFSFAGRMQEAMAACRPEVFGNDIPPVLSGREAWILSRQGNLQDAIAQMKKTVLNNSEYYWGWMMLADWQLAANQNKESLEAAKQMIRLAPRAAVPLGFAADALERLGRNEEAAGYHERAFELDHAYIFSGMKLFDAALGARKLDVAENLLTKMERANSTFLREAQQVRLHVVRNDKKAALELIDGMLLTTGIIDRTDVRAALDHAQSARWGRDVTLLIESKIENTKLHPQAAEFWVKEWIARKEWKKRVLLRKMQGKASESAWSLYITTLGENKELSRLQACQRELTAHRDSLPILVWGQMGYALGRNGKWKDTVLWLSNWERRPDAEPWMLSNLSFGLRTLGKYEEANLVTARALELPADNTRSTHLVWQALAEAVNERFTSARTLMAEAQMFQHEAWEKAALVLGQAILAVESPVDASARRVYSEHRKELREPQYKSYWQTPPLKDLGIRAVKVMGKHAGQKPFRLVPAVDGSIGMNFQTIYLILILLIFGLIVITSLIE